MAVLRGEKLYNVQYLEQKPSAYGKIAFSVGIFGFFFLRNRLCFLLFFKGLGEHQLLFFFPFLKLSPGKIH